MTPGALAAQVRQELDELALVPPGTGALDLGVSADLDGVAGFVDARGRLARHDLAWFARGEVAHAWTGHTEARALAGLRVTW